MKNETEKNGKKPTSTKKKTTSQAAKKAPSKKPTTPRKPKPTVAEPEIKKTAPKKEERKVETKPVGTPELPNLNQKGIIIIVLALVVATSILAKNFIMNENKDYTKSYLVSHKIGKGEVTKENLESVMQTNQSFILVTKLNSEEEYHLEKSLRSLIEKNDLKQEFYVYNLAKNPDTNLIDTFHLKEEIKTPTILYYKKGVLIDAVSREDEKMIEAADFSQLLDMYELTK